LIILRNSLNSQETTAQPLHKAYGDAVLGGDDIDYFDKEKRVEEK